VVSHRAPLSYQTAYKPGSVRSAAETANVTAIHLARRLPDASSNLPEWLTWTGPAPEDATPFLFGLAPGGVCRAATVAGSAVRSYRTVSPLPRRYATRRGGLFSVALSLRPTLKADPAGRYPAPLVHGARTFLPGRLSALARSGRPAD